MELKRKTNNLKMQFSQLLIVPYGIETKFSDYFFVVDNSFNRTLWN